MTPPVTPRFPIYVSGITFLVGPGSVPNEGKAHELYLQALELAAEGHVEEAAALGPLCHTCRIARPLRSKHCSVMKR